MVYVTPGAYVVRWREARGLHDDEAAAQAFEDAIRLQMSQEKAR